MDKSEVARTIDHALLTPALTEAELEQGIEIALHYKVASVCVLPFYLKRCAELLAGSDVKASATIGFPHGGHTTTVKLAEAKQALDDGGEELDMVVNINHVLSGNWTDVREEIQAVNVLVHQRGRKLKVIFENCYLNEAQKIRLCGICAELDVDWVKTSTGFGPGGATIDDVLLMRKHSAAQTGVKAAGGIRDLQTALAFLQAGANRIGTSKTAEILKSI